MKAAVASNVPTQEALGVAEWPDPSPPDGWVLVRLERAALNRLDAMMLADREQLPGPSILGSDGAGVVTRLGSGVQGVRLGDEVLISPSLFWGSGAAAPGEAYEILGSPTHGTHAGMVVVPAENVVRKPARLSWDQAAALPLSGLTAWRALVTRGRLTAGETVIVAAASSGVGTSAIQLAVALGARVVAISSSEEKLEQARSIGASETVLRRGDDVASDLAAAVPGGADLALDPTGALWQPLLQAVRPGGRLVVVGKMASESATVRVQTVYWKQVDILGSSMGSPADFAAFIEHVSTAAWAPVVDSVFPLDEIQAAYERLDAPDRVGKVVIDTSTVSERSTAQGR